jgi:DNA repair exonuclease SbcCD ATPase subunit
MAMMTAEQAAEFGKTLTFEKVWAAMMATDAKMDRLAEEADRRQREAAVEAEKRREEAAEEAEKRREEAAAEAKKRHEEAAAEAEKRQKEEDERRKVAAEEAEKRQKEYDEQRKKVAEDIQELRALHKETERVAKETSKKVGDLGNSIGALVESLIAARVWEKFGQYHLENACQRVPIKDETGRIRTDIDILLGNAVHGMIVEVKRELNQKDEVDRHLRRMELIMRYPPNILNIKDKRLMGAMAGAVVDPDVAAYAHECGFFVLEMTGESVQLVPAPAKFEPREWTQNQVET